MGWFWSKNDDALLRGHYAALAKGHSCIATLSKTLGRTRAAISNRAALLKLRNKKHVGILTFRGEKNAHWKGDAASDGSKRERTRKIVSLGPCERCGKPGVERHHKDGNPGNNKRSNIKVVCRKCHMVIDGRLKRSEDALRKHAAIFQPAKTCVACQRPYKPLRGGRCAACYQFFKRCGADRKPGTYRVVERAVGFQPGHSNPRSSRKCYQ